MCEDFVEEVEVAVLVVDADDGVGAGVEVGVSCEGERPSFDDDFLPYAEEREAVVVEGIWEAGDVGFAGFAFRV